MTKDEAVVGTTVYTVGSGKPGVILPDKNGVPAGYGLAYTNEGTFTDAWYVPVFFGEGTWFVNVEDLTTNFYELKG